MDKKRKIALIVSVVMLALSLASCGRSAGSSYQADRNKGSAAMESAEEAAAPEAAYDAAYESGEYDTADFDATAEGPAAAGDDDGGTYENQDKIVYSCSVSIQTLEYEESAKKIREAVKSAGGFLASEQESDDDYNWYEYDAAGTASGGNRMLELTVRIPTEKYDAFVESFDDFGKVLSKIQNAENISKTYNDTQSVIKTLETEEERLQSMMDKAETIEEMISVEQRLTEVQTELNRYRTNLAAMDTDIAYSTVSISLREVRRIDDPVREEDTFGQHVKKIFVRAWENFAAFWRNLVYVLIWILPGLIVIAIALFIVLFFTRKQRAAHRARKNEMRRAKREQMELQRQARASRMQQEELEPQAKQSEET